MCLFFQSLDDAWKDLSPAERETILEILVNERRFAFGGEDEDSPFKNVKLAELAATQRSDDLPRMVQWELVGAIGGDSFSSGRYREYLKRQTQSAA